MTKPTPSKVNAAACEQACPDCPIKGENTELRQAVDILVERHGDDIRLLGKMGIGIGDAVLAMTEAGINFGPYAWIDDVSQAAVMVSTKQCSPQE
jgi:hypothetical protein